MGKRNTPIFELQHFCSHAAPLFPSEKYLAPPQIKTSIRYNHELGTNQHSNQSFNNISSGSGFIKLLTVSLTWYLTWYVTYYTVCSNLPSNKWSSPLFHLKCSINMKFQCYVILKNLEFTINLWFRIIEGTGKYTICITSVVEWRPCHHIDQRAYDHTVWQSIAKLYEIC